MDGSTVGTTKRGRLRSLAVAVASVLAVGAVGVTSSDAAIASNTGGTIVFDQVVVGERSAPAFQFGGNFGEFELSADDAPLVFQGNGDFGTSFLWQRTFPLWPLTDVTCTREDGSDAVFHRNLAEGRIAIETRDDTTTCTFTNTRASVINTRAGHDADRNGLLDGDESWLTGATIEVLDSTGELIKTHTTNDAGRTRFIVPAGGYTVCHVLADGWTSTQTKDGADDGRVCRNVDLGIGEQSWDRFLSAPASHIDGEVEVAVGTYATCGLRTDRSVLCWGKTSPFITTAGDRGPLSSLAVGNDFACGLRLNDTVACWGRGDRGETNAPNGAFGMVAAAGRTACGIRTDGEVRCWGQNRQGNTNPPAGVFVDVSIGGNQTCGVRDDRQLVCWGNRFEIDLPTGTFDRVAMGAGHGCAVRTDGTVECWGNPRSVGGEKSVLDVPAGTFVDVAAGLGASCAIDEAGAVTCWGAENLGNTDVPPGLYRSISSSTYASHTCGVRLDGSVECWGWNGGSQATPPTDGFVDLVGGGWTICGVTENRTGTCWGDTRTFTEPLPIIDRASIGLGYAIACWLDEAGHATCRGRRTDGLDDVPTDRLSTVAVGAVHACGLRLDKTAICWGDGGRGQTDAPDGEFSALAVGGSFTCGLRNDASVECWGSGKGATEARDGPFASIWARNAFVCGLRHDGSAACWGDWSFRSPAEAPDGTYTELALAGSAVCGLRGDGSVDCVTRTGVFNDGSAGLDGIFMRIVGGTSDICGLRPDGAVTCVGLNSRDEIFQPAQPRSVR